MTAKPSNLLHRSLAIAEAYLEPIVELTSRLTAVPAPSNDELERSAALREILEAMGHEEVGIDEIGNGLAAFEGERHAIITSISRKSLDSQFRQLQMCVTHQVRSEP